MREKLLNHFGLSRIPFLKEVGVNELFISREIKEVETRLSFAIESDSIALVTGASGTGKTTALRYFLNSLDSQTYRVVTIAADTFKIGDLVKLALEGLNVEAPYTASKAMRLFKKTVQALHSEENIKPVIVIDESQELPVRTLASLKHLMHYDMDSVNRLFFILCASPDIFDKINLDMLKALSRRIRVKATVHPLSIEDTLRYIKHHLSLADLKNPIFPDEVISQIFSISKGVVAEINRICLNLMLLAVNESKDLIEPSMLMKAKEL